MKALLATLALAGCTDPVIAPSEPPVDPLDTVWAETIRPGSVIVSVPGTGTYTTLGAFIDDAAHAAPPGTPPELDGAEHVENVEVLESAIAAALRAGITHEQIAAGEVQLGIWGAGISATSEFRYKSLAGITLTFHVLGGTSVCAVGTPFDNLLRYNESSALIDATDLWRRTNNFIAPLGDPNVILVSHSWGGTVAEYLVKYRDALARANGPLAGTLSFAVAAGVPGFTGSFAGFGPGYRTLGPVGAYEIDRPDDPVHSFDFSRGGNGHHYIVMFGDDYQGYYGITTDLLSCGDQPGICPQL